jgi:intracellular sulfur oxidation DsrE/DsrF family protein
LWLRFIIFNLGPVVRNTFGFKPLVFVVFAWLLACASTAQDISLDSPSYIAAIELHTSAELFSVLQRADQLLMDGVALQSEPAAVTFVLHGGEVTSLLRQNYRQNKALVDLAARLSALGVVEIMACETWMGGNSVAGEELQPFVKTVIYGPEEVSRLIDEENYLYF